MIDRDAEIAAMVDEFCGEGPVSARKLRHRIEMRKQFSRSKSTDGIGFADDFQIITDETPLDDVIHAGVIGTEE